MRDLIDKTNGMNDVTVEVTPTAEGFDVEARVGGKFAGNASFYEGSNDYTDGYRITFLSVMPEFRRQGISDKIKDAFEEETGHNIIPSRLFGGEGGLTQDGFNAAVSWLEKKQPDWLPTGWREMIGDYDEDDHMGDDDDDGNDVGILGMLGLRR